MQGNNGLESKIADVSRPRQKTKAYQILIEYEDSHFKISKGGVNSIGKSDFDELVKILDGERPSLNEKHSDPPKYPVKLQDSGSYKTKISEYLLENYGICIKFHQRFSVGILGAIVNYLRGEKPIEMQSEIESISGENNLNKYIHPKIERKNKKLECVRKIMEFDWKPYNEDGKIPYKKSFISHVTYSDVKIILSLTEEIPEYIGPSNFKWPDQEIGLTRIYQKKMLEAFELGWGIKFTSSMKTLSPKVLRTIGCLLTMGYQEKN